RRGITSDQINRCQACQHNLLLIDNQTSKCMKEVLHFKLRRPKSLVVSLEKTNVSSTFRRTFLIMKFTGILLFLFSMHVSAHSVAQQVTLKTQNVSLKEVFRELNKQTGYYFIYNENIVKSTTPITVNLQNAPLKAAFGDVLDNLTLSYTIKGKTIILEKSPRSATRVPARAQQDTVTISGVVYDTQEPPMPMAGGSVHVKGTSQSTFTDES